MASSPLEVKVHSILSKGWIYRGEGNANIVLSLPKTYQILRIKKYEKSRTILRWFFDWILQIFRWDINKDVENEKRSLNFYNLVMIPIIGKIYAHRATSVNFCKPEIQKLDKQLLLLRPEHRKHKHLQFGLASLFTDYAFLPQKFECFSKMDATYAIEIKPKQGWIPKIERNFDKCPFCLNQYLKLSSLKIKHLTSYCPLDLFSGDKERMTKALNSLILNPQNNFKVFKNGLYYYGENMPVQIFYDLLPEMFGHQKNANENSLLNNFYDLMGQALLKKFSKDNGCVNCDDRNAVYFNKVKTFNCIFSYGNLPSGCVLEQILSIQKLNSLGLQKYCDVVQTLNRDNCKFDDWSYVERFLEIIDKGRVRCFKCLMQDLQPVEKNVNFNDLNLIPYLISAVANDCSFMITFKKIWKSKGIPKHLVVNIKNAKFFINVGVFDLFPKPASTIEKHMKRNIKLKNILMAQKL